MNNLGLSLFQENLHIDLSSPPSSPLIIWVNYRDLKSEKVGLGIVALNNHQSFPGSLAKCGH